MIEQPRLKAAQQREVEANHRAHRAEQRASEVEKEEQRLRGVLACVRGRVERLSAPGGSPDSEALCRTVLNIIDDEVNGT